MKAVLCQARRDMGLAAGNAVMTELGSIYHYPVKGFPGIALPSVVLAAGEGLPGDRRYAITNGIANTLDGAWLTCRSFFINAANDGLLKFANESGNGTIVLRSPDGATLSWKIGDAGSLARANQALAGFIAPLKPDPDMPAPVIAERTQLPGMLSGYWDFDDSAVSLINLASVGQLASAMGRPVDPRRFRGNLYLAGLPAWEEFHLLGKRIRFGRKGPGLEILRPIQRCPATSVDPGSGDRDLAIPAALTDHFGHAYCGMYARVVSPGRLAAGDALTVTGDARTPFAMAANPADSDPRQWPKPVELISAQLEPAGADGRYARRLEIAATAPWPLPRAQPGQRFRFHLDCDLIGVATVENQEGGTTVLQVEPSLTGDPATAHLLEKVQPGDRLTVSGPFGRG